MVEIVGPGIDGQFVDHCGIEPRLPQELGIGFAEDSEGVLDHVVVAADGHAGAAM